MLGAPTTGRRGGTSPFGAALLAFAMLGPACAGRSVLEVGPADAGADADAGGVDAGPEPITTTDKVDLLLVVDNTGNAAPAHAILAETLPYLMNRLVDPPCVNGLGNVVATPASQDVPCPVGKRDFAPLTDFHIAVITTSLGGHGADLCSPASASFKPPMNDAAHLSTRSSAGGVVPTYDNQGFLAWDPGQSLSPPGDGDVTAMTAKLVEIVNGVGRDGCGFESQLESIYRFLVDPEPPQAIVVEGGNATPQGTDDVVLTQRADFLRPDSAVVVVLVSNENDCSTREGGQYYLSNQGLANGTAYHLPRARSECAIDPRSACCVSCGQQAPPGCPPDPSCGIPYSDAEDPLNLRCFDQKRRFGIDFLYPIQRYVDGLTAPTVSKRDGSIASNPLYAEDARGARRSADLVMMTGIVGVPWPDVANDPTSIASGMLEGPLVDWSQLLPDATTLAPPLDPLMIESIAPRTGTSPITGLELAPPGSTDALANPINGHERQLPLANDLQYACIFPLPAPLDCSDGSCECFEPSVVADNPICQAPDGSFGTVQRFGRALPATRELALLQGLGERARVASLCAPVTKGPSLSTYGYKPAVDALLQGLRRRLREP